MKQQRPRIVKFVVTVESERHDWGFQVTHPTLGLVATGKTEQEALEKMDKLVSQRIESDLAHGKYKAAKV
jgi:predicted RNase H-like HicB family nuclease